MKYSKNFKNKIINLYKKGTSSTHSILKYHIPKSTFYEWIGPFKQKILSKQIQNELVKYKTLIKSYEALKLEYDIANACHCFKDDSSDIKLAAIESNYGKIQQRLCVEYWMLLLERLITIIKDKPIKQRLKSNLMI